MTSRRLGLLGLAVFALALGACSSSSSSKAASGSTTSTLAKTTTTVSSGGGASTTPKTTTSGSTPSNGSTPSTTARATGTPSCTFSQLSVTATGDSATGHIGVLLRFENKSTHTCSLIGYPGVAALNAAGRQVEQAKRTLHGFIPGVPDGQSPPLVTITPGQSASAFVEGTDIPQGNDHTCPTYPKLLVTPPNTTQQVTIDMSMGGCSQIQVHPVVPGTSGAIT